MAAKGISELRKIIAQVRKLPVEGRQEVSIALQASALSLIGRGFDRSQAPDGSAWAPIHHRDGMPLVDHEHLRGSWMPGRATGRGFSIATNSPYAAVHQFGHTFERTSKKGKKYQQTVTPRPMIPIDALPASWETEFTAVATKALANFLRRV